MLVAARLGALLVCVAWPVLVQLLPCLLPLVLVVCAAMLVYITINAILIPIIIVGIDTSPPP